MIECACGSCNTDVVTDHFEYQYRGYVRQVEFSYIECQDCGLEFQDAEQINHYAQRVREVKLNIDQHILDELGE